MARSLGGPAATSSRRRLRARPAALLAAFCALSFPAAADPALRDAFQRARWPADIVASGDRFLASQPAAADAEQARADLAVARKTQRLLERADIRLYRPDFAAAGLASPTLQTDLRRAALADKEAALRIAHRYRDGADGVEPNGARYVGWLQYAAALGHAGGSYELALHYRRDNQPALAAPYEARAEELGFKPPPALDHVRK